MIDVDGGWSAEEVKESKLSDKFNGWVEEKRYFMGG